jgi:prepilin-type N-terminal cleavage/methylation domain-containing protein
MISTKDNGITLVELLIAISIVCILAVALGFEYADWVGRYRVETQIREMHLDLRTL